MANQLIGTIVSIGQPLSLSTKSGASFTKRDLVISIQKFDPNTGQPYSDKSNTPQVTFIGDKCAELDKYQAGQLVRVSFDVTGTTYIDRNNESRIINDIRGYRIEPYGVQAYQRPTPAYPQQPYPQQKTFGQGQNTLQGYATQPQATQPPQPSLGQPQMPMQNTQATQMEGDGLPF